MTVQRTYWHLTALGRRPSDYEVATSRLLHHPDRGFAVATPMAGWHAAHALSVGLSLPDWESFDDPRSTTYARYVRERRDQEVFVDGLLSSAAVDFARLPAGWLASLAEILGPLRYPLHGLQMTAAHVGALSPSGKLATLFLFLAADELRAVQRVSYRLRQLQRWSACAPDGGLSAWTREPRWQPLREFTEVLLTAHDACDAFAGLCLIGKPVIDGLFFGCFAERAREEGDHAVDRLLGSLAEDAAWHEQWAGRFVATLVRADAANRRRLSVSVDRFWPLARRALEALAPAVAGADPARARAVLDRVRARVGSLWEHAGLELVSPEGAPS